MPSVRIRFPGGFRLKTGRTFRRSGHIVGLSDNLCRLSQCSCGCDEAKCEQSGLGQTSTDGGNEPSFHLKWLNAWDVIINALRF